MLRFSPKQLSGRGNKIFLSSKLRTQIKDRRIAMVTLCIRYDFNPDKLADFRAYVEAERGPIERNGGRIVGYFLPTDFAGPTNEAMGLIDLPSLAAYEQYRKTLADDPDHQRNFARLVESGAGVAMNRSIIQRVDQRS